MSKNTITQFIKFSIVGVSGASINLGITYILTEYVSLWYLLSNAIAQILAITNNFYWNKFKTFQKHDGHIHKQYIMSLVTYIISGSLSVGLTYIFTDLFGIWYIYSIILTIPLGMIINFSSHKLVVFK